MRDQLLYVVAIQCWSLGGHDEIHGINSLPRSRRRSGLRYPESREEWSPGDVRTAVDLS